VHFSDFEAIIRVERLRYPSLFASMTWDSDEEHMIVMNDGKKICTIMKVIIQPLKEAV